jgi:hypothetical protein
MGMQALNAVEEVGGTVELKSVVKGVWCSACR